MPVRRSLAAATALGVATTLAGCGVFGGDDETTVTMWTYPVIAEKEKHQAFFDEAVKAFEKENPDVEVEVKIYPWENREEALTTAIAGGKGPDVVYLIPDQIPMFQDQGVLEPIADHVSDEALSGYRQNALDAVSVDDDLYALPVLMSATPPLCDKRAFKAAGVEEYPQTWDELLALGPKFKSAGYYLAQYVADPSQSLNQSFYPFLWQAGGKVFSEDGSEIAFNGPEGEEALGTVKELVDSGYVPEELLTSLPPMEQMPLAEGKVACLLSDSPPLIVPYWGEENIEVLPPLTNEEQVMYGGVGAYGILEGSDQKEAAADWISFLTEPEMMKKYDLASGFFAPRDELQGLYADDPVLGAVEEQLEYAYPGALNPKAREVMGVLAPQIQAALLGKTSPEQALDDAAEAAAPLLER